MTVSTPNTTRQVRVGVAAVIIGADGRMILGRRKGSLGAGQWGFPGGHLEFGESYFECAERESLEETGLRIKAFKVFAVANTVFDSEHHYITIFVQCKQDNPDDQPQVLEPEKCHGWDSMSWDDIKSIMAKGQEELFLPIVNLLLENPNPELLIKA
ncbi:nudix domain-containing protein [Coniochaeta ligniaria NRRL 30616]|uniref:Nudix domain-containing protein n=1 Tax=Coniochaeta ligniaria NRRL 30616 TaxID=1408157 RepID=A0A1J7J8H9_9PEZI|nr:nudix domain-containing protein [Coniochaeta ligniaria NRRL 30616]